VDGKGVRVQGRKGVRRATLSEAAELLGISKGAVRQRVRRRTLRSDKGEDGRVYVYVDPTADAVHHTAPPAPLRAELVDELRDRIRYLERQVEQANERDHETRRVILALTSRIPELQAPSEATGGPQTGEQEPERVEDPDPQTGTQRRTWWRRVFGLD